MATLTVYPDAHIESTSVDGHAAHSEKLSWANLRGAVGNVAADSSATQDIAVIRADEVSSDFDYLLRSIFLFDTSTLTSSATVSAATFSIYGNSKLNTLGLSGTDFKINVYASAPNADVAVVAGDFDSLLSTPLSDTDITYDDFSIAGYNAFILNSSGRTLVSKTGITKFGIREVTFDVGGATPTWGAGHTVTALNAYFADTATPEKRPKLVITYTSPATVTTQVVKDNWGTTATGQGNITDLGSANPTAHGHCWNTSTNPTTSNSVVDNGAATATGAFTSAMTGLTPGTGYYVRAYATNEGGTAYGANVYFVASLIRAGHIWMEGSNFRGFDENAVERKYIHTADVDDAPVDAATEDPISSNWAYDMEAIVAAKDYGLSFEGIVTTATDTTHFKVSTLAGKGTGFFIPASGDPYEIYVVQADAAAPEGEHKPVVAYTSSDGTFQHAVFSAQLAVGDIVLIIHPWLARLLDLYTDWKDGGRLDLLIDAIIATVGAVDTAAATGAVTSSDLMMAYIKEIVTGLALDGSAPHSYDYTKATVPGWLKGFHMVRRILFICPEALSSGLPNTAHNTAILAVLNKSGMVQTITQADALIYPDYEATTLIVLGSPLAGTAWTTTNLAHVKAIFGLPIICVDAAAAAYLQMGTDGDNAASKTVLNAVSNIEGSILGLGIDDTTGLAAGANTVAASGVTFSTLDMSDTDVTEIWYAWETTEANTDVLIGEIRKTMPDGSVGLDADGAEVPGTLAFYGCAYSMDSLNTLGQAVLHLLVEQLLHSSTAGLAVQLSGNVGNLVNTIGVKATPAATGAVSNAKKMMAYVKQLVTALILVLADTGELQTDWADGGRLDLLIDAITGYVDCLPANFSTQVQSDVGAALTTYDPPTKGEMDTGHGLLATPAQVATALDTYDAIKRSEATTDKNAIITEVNANETKIDALENLSAANVATELETYDAVKRSEATSDKEAVIAAIPAMVGTDNAATEAKQDIIDTNVDDIETLVATKVVGRSQIFEKSITSASNAGDVTVATITAQPCLIESVVIHADAAQTSDMTSCGVFGGASKAITFIAATDALQADLDAENKQVAWTGAVRLPANATIVISLVGSNGTAVDLTITTKYRACVSGGYLA